MIVNDSQYNVTKQAAEGLRRALENRESSTVGDIHPVLVEAHWAGVADELALLEKELFEYDQLKLGLVDLSPSSLENLPETLIRARIARGLSQRGLAEALELKAQQIQRYEAERYRSASFGRILAVARVLGVDIASDVEDVDPIEDMPTSLFPVAEMARRGWFEDFSGTPLQAKKQAEQLLPGFFRAAGMYGNQLAYHRRSERKGSGVDEAALLAWEGRIRSLALRQPMNHEFQVSFITDDWIKGLVQLSTSPDGPSAAVDELQRIGISLVYEPVLQGTRLDGAALRLYTGTPVIGLTLRYDRIDNFWFTLLHELGHVKLHLHEVSQAAILDDLEEVAGNPIESAADLFAQEALVPSAQWARCISRFSRTEKAVLRDAERLRVHPAIVAGRIRKEAEDYTLLSHLVGSSQVKVVLQERFGHYEAD
jgi:HTH-type transcriptional regulator/antitoxin HigA